MDILEEQSRDDTINEILQLLLESERRQANEDKDKAITKLVEKIERLEDKVDDMSKKIEAIVLHTQQMATAHANLPSKPSWATIATKDAPRGPIQLTNNLSPLYQLSKRISPPPVVLDLCFRTTTLGAGKEGQPKRQS